MTAEQEARLEADLHKITTEKTVKIPDPIVPSLMKLVKYILKGTFLLNRLAKEQPLNTVPVQRGFKRIAKKISYRRPIIAGQWTK